jgi:hypothetical protein
MLTGWLALSMPDPCHSRRRDDGSRSRATTMGRSSGIAVVLFGWIVVCWLDSSIRRPQEDCSCWRHRLLTGTALFVDALAVSSSISKRHSFRLSAFQSKDSSSSAEASRTWTLPKRGDGGGGAPSPAAVQRGGQRTNADGEGNGKSASFLRQQQQQQQPSSRRATTATRMTTATTTTTTTTTRPLGNNSNTRDSFGRKFKQRPLPVTGYDAAAILEYYDMRPLAVGWRLNILGFPLLGEFFLLCSK